MGSHTTVGQWRRSAAALLADAGHASGAAQADVAAIARHLLGWDAAAWLARQDAVVEPGLLADLQTAIARRRDREPVAYILGEREFYGRTFVVDRNVLIPRPETEDVVTAALERLDAAGWPVPRLLDVGTGSGCISITMACERPSARVAATDVSGAALDVARKNRARHGVAERVTFELTHLTGGADGTFDLVLSNPPYVAGRDRDALAPDVRDFEPAVALFAGPDGLAVMRELVPSAHRALAPGGWFVVEFGAGQRDAVTTLLREAGFVDLDVRRDLANLPRVAVARRAGTSV